MLHSAELHVLQASTLTNDGVAKGAKGVPEGQTARPGTENSPKFTRPVAPPSSPITYNLPAKHGFNLTLSRYRSARTSRRAYQSMFTFFLSTSVAVVNRLSLRKAYVVLLPAKPTLLQPIRISTHRKHTRLVLTFFRDQQKRDN